MSASDRRIGVLLNPKSFAPHVEAALGALGYQLLHDAHPDTTEASLWVVDIDRFGEIPDEALAPELRLVLIAQPRDFRFDDPRVVDYVKRPARLSSLYSVAQRALEATPRATPRVATRLSARSIRDDRRSIGAVLSLSEGGCLFRTADEFSSGTHLDLQFALPDYGLVSTRAECRYVGRGSVGLAFSEPASDVRHTIAHFVTMQLALLQQDSALSEMAEAARA